MVGASKRLLISVSDKTGIVAFARALAAKGFELISSGGTYKHLREAGLEPILVSGLTGFPEILDGRVKTLHPRIHGALLARYELESHRRQLKEHGIDALHGVVVNLYPFSETIKKQGVAVADAIEQIDIGGPTMIRAAAKNFQNLSVLTDPDDYPRYLESLGDNGLPDLAFRLELAQKAFQHSFSYDMRIADYLDGVRLEGQSLQPGDRQALPAFFRFSARKEDVLRYGENPHQAAAFYRVAGSEMRDYMFQHQGKTLSYNNLVDMESAWRCVLDFAETAAVVVKHTNPCGVGLDPSLERAFRRARKVDPVSSFGGVIALNRPVDLETAQAIVENFAELVIAPSFTPEALKRFRKKKNLRVLEMRVPEGGFPEKLDFKRLDHGLLLQEKDRRRVPFEDWQLVSERRPDEAEAAALKLAWTIVAHVKSNAIVYASREGAIGIGAGQMSRVDSAKVAIRKAAEADLAIAGSAMASDAFFPFRDSVDAAAAAGVTAIVEPGGSIRDDEVIQAANQHGLTLFFTGTRHFKH